ncbi:molecular chaperone [Bordetella bronchiseptica]|uniref:fimbrial biogenesis chaperone n=1 Tax=Bordetella bronchiseptica TaxID=518 RepID=UPI003F747939
MNSRRYPTRSYLRLHAAAAIIGTVASWLTFGSIPAAQAAVLQVSPVRLHFEPVQSAQALQVFNSGQNGLEAQVRVMRWTQENGEDRLTPAKELVASPAIMRVAPGERQTVRIVRLDPSPSPDEQTYRILIDELPPKESPKGVELKVLLRYSIPVFIAASSTKNSDSSNEEQAPLKTDISLVCAKLAPRKDGAAELRVSNRTPQSLRISSLSAISANGQTQVLEDGLLGYVLPGKQMEWAIKSPAQLTAGLTLKARFNDDTDTQAVPLEGTCR